jgi:hypothetical protein
MAKTVKKRPIKKRGKKGGDVINSLAEIKTKNAMILAELQWAEENDDCDFSQIKEIAQDEKQIIKNEIEKQLAKKEEPKEEPVISNDEASGVSPPIIINEKNKDKQISILEQMITVNGFTGTVGELLSRMREKVIQLKKNTANKYMKYSQKLNSVMKKISSDTIENVDKIKQILKDEQLTFKNNQVFGGKTKKGRQSMKKEKLNRKTKRR